MRQFDLQFALVTARAPGENAEDQAGAVQNRAFQLLFQVALLRRGEFVVEHHHHRIVLAHRRFDLLDLARTCEKSRVGPLPPALDKGARLQPGTLDQQPQLFGAFGVATGTEIQADQHGRVCARWALRHGARRRQRTGRAQLSEAGFS